MTEWKAELQIRDLHKAYLKGEITTSQLAKQLAQRLHTITRYKKDSEYLDIIEHFEDLADEKDPTKNDYDSALERLYYFGDADHRLWLG